MLVIEFASSPAEAIEAVRKRLQGLGITEIYLGAHDKIKQYYQLVDKYNLLPENILYMGDDVPDYPVMELVGFPCAPQDAAPEIKEISKYISPKKGGEGCVRDVIEQNNARSRQLEGEILRKIRLISILQESSHPSASSLRKDLKINLIF